MPDSDVTSDVFVFLNRESPAAAPETVSLQAKLVDRISAGDEDAFGELYRMYAPMAHGIILTRVPRNDVDDIVQEVFISAYQNLKSLRDKDAVGAWLAMIARNRAAEYFRRAKPMDEIPDEIRQGDSHKTEAGEILAAIRSLPEAYKETLVLRLVEGMTGQEIAEQTGLTPNSVRVNLHRGMRLLRQALGLEVKR